MRSFDTEVLRSFAAIADSGGFAHAGARVHRTQSTISLQMKRLEAQADTKLFRRDGRRMVLTEAGEVLLSYARRILELNDEAQAALTGVTLSGPLHFGTTQDFADSVLPRILARFVRSHPALHLDVRVERSAPLLAALDSGELDLVLTVQDAQRGGGAFLRHEPLVWIAGEGFTPAPDAPLPLVLFEPPCIFRDTALGALNERRIPWRIAYTSPSLTGLRAAVQAGLGVTLRTRGVVDGGLRILTKADGLPALGGLDFALYRSPATQSPAAAKLAEIVAQALI